MTRSQSARFTFSFSRTYVAIGPTIALLPVAAMGLLAAGMIGPIRLIGAPVDRELVISSLLHSTLGCILTSIQWGSGAGLAFWFCGETSPRPEKLMLLGFPFSLGVIAAWSYITLAVPVGWIPATVGLLACFWPFVRRPPNPEYLSRIVASIFAMAPMAVLLGCWMGLLAHGPTYTLPGRPSGDLAFYATSIYSLEQHPFPFVNLANEGEVLMPFNLLHPLLGAALLHLFSIDPFQFVLATAASTYAFGLGLAIFAYCSLRTHAVSRFAFAILALGTVVAVRYPYWIVESSPVIFALPLSIAIWYRATNTSAATDAFKTLPIAVTVSAMTKVTTVITLAPIALTPLIQKWAIFAAEFHKLPRLLRLTAILIFAGAMLYAAFLTSHFGYFMISQGGISPESFERFQWATENHVSRRLVVPYALRDAGTLLLILLAFRMVAWPSAVALTMGAISGLVFPYVLRINVDCVLIILALAGIDDSDILGKSKYLALAAYLLCLPAILQTDFGSYPSGVMWILCVGTMTVVACFHAQKNAWESPALRHAGLGATAVSLFGALTLVAFARQEIAFVNPETYLTIEPATRNIWAAVRQRTPADALVFTDQTGKGPDDSLDLNASWNTYAVSGQRQIYIAGWYQSPELRQSAALLRQRLATNESVLAGRTPPMQLQYHGGPYTSYFAVVSRSRQMPRNWRIVYQNQLFALYRYAAVAGN